MSTSPRVLQLQGQNVSYAAKSQGIARTLIELGLQEGGILTRDELLANPSAAADAVVILADAYHLHEDQPLAEALAKSTVLVAPSVFRPAEAAHAADNGITAILPVTRKRNPEDPDLKAYREQGTILLVDEIRALPIPNARATLLKTAEGEATARDIDRLVELFPDHSLFYPPGSFSIENKTRKAFLTEKDIKDQIKLIAAESAKGALVICGDRVDPEVVVAYKDAFKGNPAVALVSQKVNKKADLPSVYIESVLRTGHPPAKVFIDGIAGTTLALICTAAGLRGRDGLSLLTSEHMPAYLERRNQVAEFYYLHGAKRIVSIGKQWDITIAPPPPLAPTESLKSALRAWLIARRLLPCAPAETSKSGPQRRNNSLA